MKNYFEHKDGSIIPFEKVLFVNEMQNGDIDIYSIQNDTGCTMSVPIEQLETYKQWLDMKMNIMVMNMNVTLNQM